ncbi:glucosaminidase domain-containing protein [Fusobacterium sp.]|uniref:glucosaminidase domain-containing protein n=1 Tax=Fusobacterium sp. TaxID=68766 RepID=UPI0029030302|nr:glucosaminidase domain-containing protein [Fusobacterium sp.]MDU1911781.1 glucosaminidase domain-containing protein [Fusobacterium sp.]
MKIKKYLLFGIFIMAILFKYSDKKINDNILKKVEYKKIEINSVADLYEKRDEEGLYVFSNEELDLRKLSSEDRKDAFVQLLLPAINVVHEEIKNDKEIVKKLEKKSELTEEEKEYCENIFSRYRVEYGNWQELESKMIIYPTSLILTQGALESAWGTSRFFREGNNIFGMWSTNPNEPRIAAKGTRDNGFVPHLKKYDTIKDSVADIVLTISRNDVYKKVRESVNNEKPASEIVYGLIKYSEEGEEYIKKIKATMEKNDFLKYDLD